MNARVSRRVDWVMKAALKVATDPTVRNRLENIQLYSAYAEPGCSDPESGVIALADWNQPDHYDRDKQEWVPSTDDTFQRVQALFEKLGVEMEWEDEWKSCDECGGLCRTSPDSYGWRPAGTIVEDSYLCQDCIKNNSPAEYLKSLENNPRKAVQIDINPADHGYFKVEGGFENGFHPGQDADPEVMAKTLRSFGLTRFLFTIDSVGQFDMNFSVWLHKSQRRKFKAKLEEWRASNKDGPSVSGAMQRGLMEAARQAAELPDGPGVIVSRISGDRVTTKLVSPEDWVEGKSFD